MSSIPPLNLSQVPFVARLGTGNDMKTSYGKKTPDWGQFEPTTSIVSHSARDGATGLIGEGQWVTTNCETFRPPPGNQPRKLVGNPRDKWLRLDRQVLRFYMYFKEAVHESRLESKRLRKCVLLYYLADDTVQIVEPKVENSGIPQGAFLQKTPIRQLKGDTNNDLQFDRLVVGNHITILGRTFRIVDCDPSTRKFFTEDLGIEQPQAEEYPPDTLITIDYGKAGNSKRGSLQKMYEGDNETPRYMANDGKILNFTALWDNSSVQYGQKRYFTLHYYLADDTIEIRERQKANSGRGNFPVFLRRTKVYRPDGDKLPILFPDLVCGEEISFLSRKYKLLNCDFATREFYSKIGIDQVKQEIKQNKVPAPKLEPPPYTGFGSEEDSLGSFYNLVPRPPKTKFFKNDGKEGQTLVFLAKFKTDSPHDKDREFVISFFIVDESLSIYEPPRRNSGVTGGKFLERKRYPNPNTGAKFVAEDFREPLKLGGEKTIKLCNQEFVIYKGDKFTRQYFNHLQEVQEDSFAEQIFKKIVNQMLLKRVNVRKMFQKADLDGSKSISKSEFKALIAKFGIFLDSDDLNNVMKKFSNGQAEIWYNDFCDIISSHWTPARSNSTDRIDQLEEEILLRLRERNSQLRKVFRKFDEDKNGILTFNEFQNMLKHYNFHLSPYEITELMSRYDQNKEGTINYNEFCDKVYQCDFSFVDSNSGASAKIKMDDQELNINDYMAMLQKQEDAMAKKIQENTVMNRFAKALSQKKFVLRREFLHLDKTRTGVLGMDAFFQALEKVVELNDDDKFALSVSLFPDPAEPNINYDQFFDTMVKQLSQEQSRD